MYFPKHYYESIVHEKSGINMFIALLFPKYCIMTSIYRQCNVFGVILNDKGRNSVEQNATVPDFRKWFYCVTGHYCFRVQMLLTNEYPRIYLVMH